MAEFSARPRVLKTYSRAHKRPISATEDADSTKRRRVENELPLTTKPKLRPAATIDAWLCSSRSSTSSSTLGSSDNAIFSDAPNEQSNSSPPSSPPALLPDLESAQAALGEVAQAINRVETPALRVLGSNVQRPATSTSAAKVQTQINLGANLQKTCKECGMTYLRCDAGDSALHDKFHTRNLHGVDMGKAFRKWAEGHAVLRAEGGNLIVVVGSSDKTFERKKAREVLDVVQTELGAVDIPDEELWAKPTELPEEDCRTRYRSFLYMEGLRCVGFCLARSIQSARTVVERSRDDAGWENGPDEALIVSDDTAAARIGISRIWTSKSHRKRRIGTTLLDCVARTFHPTGAVSKSQVAFSQPTTSGTVLARNWFGKQYGWLVYID